MTPMPFASEIGTAPTPMALGALAAADRAQRVARRHRSEPLPQKYKVDRDRVDRARRDRRAALFAFVRGNDEAAATQPTQIVPVPVAVPTVDNETRAQGALHDLETGKTCADRKAAIPMLVELGDERAIPALKKARYRMRGGVLGIGDSNTNACLKTDAEVAIQTLGGDARATATRRARLPVLLREHVEVDDEADRLVGRVDGPVRGELAVAARQRERAATVGERHLDRLRCRSACGGTAIVPGEPLPRIDQRDPARRDGDARQLVGATSASSGP